MQSHVHLWSRQDKEAWIKDKYVEKKFLRKLTSAPAREPPRRWRAQKCQRPHSSPHAPTTRRKVRLEPVLPSVAALSSGGRGCQKLHLSSCTWAGLGIGSVQCWKEPPTLNATVGLGRLEAGLHRGTLELSCLSTT